MIKTSGPISTSSLVESTGVQLHSVNITQAATGAGSVIVYDNTSAAGRIVFRGDGLTEMSYPLGNFAGGGVGCASGLYVSLGGTANAVVVLTFE